MTNSSQYRIWLLPCEFRCSLSTRLASRLYASPITASNVLMNISLVRVPAQCRSLRELLPDKVFRDPVTNSAKIVANYAVCHAKFWMIGYYVCECFFHFVCAKKWLTLQAQFLIVPHVQGMGQVTQLGVRLSTNSSIHNGSGKRRDSASRKDNIKKSFLIFTSLII